MMKHEFERLALRNDATISTLLYETIERFYMATNNYHAAHGGINETKRDFVKRVFGGKVNTPKTICKKIIKEAQKENRWCLIGCPSGTPEKLKQMDELIAEHITWKANQHY